MASNILHSGLVIITLFLATQLNPLALSQEPVDQIVAQYGHGLNWESSLRIQADWSIKVLWQSKVGEGRSQVVGQRNRIYVATGSMEKKKSSVLKTRVSCIDLKDGSESWAFSLKSNMYDDQETFGGSTAAPQATPLIVGEHLIVVSFTGQVVCLNRNDGELVWQKDLVKDLGAEPVQFGFSSSPVTSNKNADRFYLLGAGKEAGFYCLSTKDGSVVWKADCQSSSYATPVATSLGGVDQWVVVNENEVFGVSHLDGKRLWKFEFPATGLTNVPTPVVIDDSRIVLSGQGCKGTRCIKINEQSNEWDAKEVWFAREIQLFYTNWLKLNESIAIGCTDKFMAAIDVTDGSVLGRWRGFGDGNVALVGKDILVIDGKGNLSLLEPASDNESQIAGLQVTKKYKVLDARCWTPLSVIDNKILIRGDDQLVCLAINNQSDSSSLENLVSETKELNFELANSAETEQDPVEQIFGTFEAKGQEAALKLYTKLRKQKKLDESARIAIASSAKEAGLVEVAQLIMTHAKQDFPDSKEIALAANSILGKK